MRLAIALALATAALAAAPAHAATAYRGVQLSPLRMDPAGVTEELTLAKKARVNLVKVDVSWAVLEPEAGAYSAEYLDRIDDFTRAAAQRNLDVLLLLQTTPCWTDSDPAGPCDTDDGSDYPPQDHDAYGRAAALLAERFGSRIAAIEIWNEPDHVNEEYWKGDDKAGRYVQLVRATYSKVKDADSRVQVLAGSMVGASGAFLQQLYDAGIKGHYDGLSVHYYDLVLASLRSIKATLDANGDRSRVWLTEFGYTSCYPGRRRQEGHECVSRRQQGKFLLDIFRAVRKTRWVKAGVIYNMRDTEQYKFGLASPTFEPKPVLRKLAKAFKRRRLAAPRKVKLRETRKGVKLTAPVGDVMKLQAFKGPCKRQGRGSRARFEDDSLQLVRGRFHWKKRALRRGKWCIYAQHYWTGREAFRDLT